ncbi:C39 family peptidase [Dactylosporangium sp. CA-052675]|uniref:C39 family peptidase n=1 Tax=Dactylosporangium sp. CA-052675 TaxID=3239927 RepID=UPI003D8AB01C
MSYIYRSRHARRILTAPRLPVAVASAVVALAAGLGAVAASNASVPSAPPAAAAEAVVPRESPSKADRAKRPTAAPTQSQSQSQSQSQAQTSAPAAPAAPAQLDLPYQFAWQENYYFCGPAATRIALTARNLFPSQSQVAQSLGTTESGTNSSQDTTRALNAYTGSNFYTAHFIRGQSASAADTAELKQRVVHAISQGYAVVANISGSTVDDAGNGHAYPGGHYLTIVGYSNNGDTVRIADPADALGVGSYTLGIQRMADWIALRGYAA